MTTQYNIVSYGTLTNTNGVLSNFSASNYATIPLTFNPVQHPYEIVFKVNTGIMPTNTSCIIWQTGDTSTSRGRLDLEVWKDKFYAEFASDNELRWAIENTVTTLQANTDYYVKLTYNGTNTYTLSSSTNGTTWTTEGTATSNAFLRDGSAEYNIIGIQPDNGGIIFPWFGSIDLNESYININDIRWWQGVTSTSNVQTRIQLRHDTATNWASVNPVLLEGEVGLEIDTGKSKVGDGSTAWNSLAYDLASTALQSSVSLANITLSNVTSIDANSAVQTALDGKVSKSGDTMTGTLTIQDGQCLIATDYDKGSAPSTTTWNSLEFVGTNNSTAWQDKRLGIVELTSNTDSSSSLGLRCYQNATSSTNYSALTLNMSSSGVASCTFPNTTCVDGQWVNLYQEAVGSSAYSLAGSTEHSWTFSNLPSTNCEVLVQYKSSANDIAIRSDLITSTAMRATGVAGQVALLILPVSSSKKIYLRNLGTSASNITFFRIHGYRKLGSNAQ